MEILEALAHAMAQEGIDGIVKETASGWIIEILGFQCPIHVWLLEHEIGIGVPWRPAVSGNHTADDLESAPWDTDRIVERFELANPSTTPELIVERVGYYGKNGPPVNWKGQGLSGREP